MSEKRFCVIIKQSTKKNRPRDAKSRMGQETQIAKGENRRIKRKWGAALPWQSSHVGAAFSYRNSVYINFFSSFLLIRLKDNYISIGIMHSLPPCFRCISSLIFPAQSPEWRVWDIHLVQVKSAGLPRALPLVLLAAINLNVGSRGGSAKCSGYRFSVLTARFLIFLSLQYTFTFLFSISFYSGAVTSYRVTRSSFGAFSIRVISFLYRYILLVLSPSE